jgi:ABC-type phosphate transport system auxiliary subunit
VRSTRKLLEREVMRALLQGKSHHPLSLSYRMMSQKRSQLKSKSQKRSQLKSQNKEVTRMTTQTLRTLTQRMEMLRVTLRQRSGRWSFVTMMEGMHAFRPN